MSVSLGRTVAGQEFIPPTSGDIAAELTTAMSVLDSTRGNIGASIANELDAAGQAVALAGGTLEEYINGALAEAAGVYDYLRAVATANIDGPLNAANEALGQIEAILAPPAINIVGDQVDGIIGTGSVPHGAAGLNELPLDQAGSSSSLAGQSGPANQAATGQGFYSFSGISPSAQHGQLYAKNNVTGQFTEQDGFSDYWFQPDCQRWFFYSLEPTPLTRYSADLYGSGTIYLNTIDGRELDPTTEFPGFPGLFVGQAQAYYGPAVFQHFLAEYTVESIQAFLDQCKGATPAFPASSAGSSAPGSSAALAGMPASSSATIAATASSSAALTPTANVLGNAPCHALIVPDSDVPFPPLMDVQLYCNTAVNTFPLWEGSATYATPETPGGSWTIFVRLTTEGPNYGPRVALSLVHHVLGEYSAVLTDLAGAATAGAGVMLTGNIASAELGRVGTVAVSLEGADCLDWGKCLAPVPAVPVLPAAPPVTFVAPPSPGGCPAPVIQVNCGQCGRPMAGHDDEADYQNELEWLLSGDSNSDMARFTRLLGPWASTAFTAGNMGALLSSFSFAKKGASK